MKKGVCEATGKEVLQKELDSIAAKGIDVDSKNLAEDMCAQFVNAREWIREYVVNAFDAHASRCHIYGQEDEKTITIVVEDNGHGMDRKRVRDFTTLFRSVKLKDNHTPIGKYGIGKLSVAANQCQCGFTMITSTGKECWHMKAGRLLDGSPITLEQITPVPAQGTRFEITFTKGASLEDELCKLQSVLTKYVKYLPLEIVLSLPVKGYPETSLQHQWVHGEWSAQAAMFGRSYSFGLSGRKYEVIFSLGRADHEIYQNRVLVTNRYNLLSYNLSYEISMPHLNIRVDSEDFELPFGRHCLSNEHVLEPLAKHLRRVILPQYMTELCRFFDESVPGQHSVPSLEVEELLCAMMKHDSERGRPWCRIPVFTVKNQPRLSLDGLRSIVAKTGIIFIEGDDNTGIDYTAFEAPVLSNHQPGFGLELLKKLFAKKIVNLSIEDVVIEIPKGYGKKLGQRERNFEKYLGFHPEALKTSKREGVKKGGPSPEGESFLSLVRDQDISGVCEESLHALKDLKSVKWRVNYLVERDGKTPCRSQRFLLKDDTVILNLSYPEIEQLLELSQNAPALVGHWAIAMCMIDENKILPHLTPEAREDIILVDAMAKCGTTEAFNEYEKDDVIKNGDDKFMRDFLRNLEDDCRRRLS
jgi:hypothetical protein